jgi:hypothetical protein
MNCQKENKIFISRRVVVNMIQCLILYQLFSVHLHERKLNLLYENFRYNIVAWKVALMQLNKYEPFSSLYMRICIEVF